MEGSLLRIVFVVLVFETVAGLDIQNPDAPEERQFTKSVKLGDTVLLKCTERLEAGESALTNVVRWHKTQNPAERKLAVAKAGVEVSSVGSVHEEFRITGRFNIFLREQNPLVVHLNISRVQEEDSGWYTCFATSGTKTVSITYELYVYVPPSSLQLTGVPTTELNDSSVTGPLLFYSTENGVLRCTAVGSLPPPTLRMSIEGEKRPLTGHGKPFMEYKLTGSIIGMQKILYDTTITISNLRVRADQNGKRVHCTATDSRDEPVKHPSLETSRVLSVLYPPNVIGCSDDWKANINDANIKFGCSFEANPVPNVLWKSIDRHPVDIYPDGKIVNNLYSAQVMATTMKTSGNISIFQTDLNLVRVTKDSYHRYELELSNELGQVTRDFVLNQGDAVKKVVVGGNGAGFVTSSTSLVLCVVTLTAALCRQ